MNEAEKLAAAMDSRVVRNWVHSTGTSPKATGFKHDAECQQAAALLRRQAEQIKLLRRVLDLCLEVIDRADTAAGYCCCGESIDGHADAMICGHSAVDAGHYASSHIVAEARSALAATKEET